MGRPDYLTNQIIDWEMMDIIIGGRSSLDSDSFLGKIEKLEDVEDFLDGYGFNSNDPVSMAELFGNFHESLQFIKRYFLKEGNADGLDVLLPSVFYTLTDVKELFLIAVKKHSLHTSEENAIWAQIILKVMHTILHTDKDLRYRYFSIIQQQIFDRFYKFLHRDKENQLFIQNKSTDEKIMLVDFQTKAKKSRDSIIIKLLHKAENVAEELFDRIGVRIITNSRFDSLRALKFLSKNYVIMANNIKPSRSVNTLVDLTQIREKQSELIKRTIREDLSEKEYAEAYNEILEDMNSDEGEGDNRHTRAGYKAIHFTCRQLIKYKNPFMASYKEVKKLARELDEEMDEGLDTKGSKLVKKVLSLDTSSIAKDVRFFYPFEVQITDEESHLINTEGEASHQEYKKAQLRSALIRLFKPLIEFKEINF